MDRILARIVLQKIRDSGDFEELATLGYTYSQIAETLLFARKEGYFRNTETGFQLTQEGIDQIRQTKPYIAPKPLDKFRITQIALDDIYVPDTIERRQKGQ